MTRRREKARFRDVGQLGLPFGRRKRGRNVLALGDIRKGNDDAFDPVVLGAVGKDATEVPGARLGFDLLLRRRERIQYGSGIVCKGVIRDQRMKVGYRPANVTRDDVEQRFGCRREEPDLELGVEKQRCDIGAVEYVLKVIRCRALSLQGFLELAVERGQFFVQRLQFLL